MGRNVKKCLLEKQCPRCHRKACKQSLYGNKLTDSWTLGKTLTQGTVVGLYEKLDRRNHPVNELWDIIQLSQQED